MDFLKKHYEKLILGVVLVGLVVAAGFIPFKIASERKELEEKREALIPRSVKPLTNLDLTVSQTSLKRVSEPIVLNLSVPHRLYNPVPWQKGANSQLFRYDDSHIGPKAVVINKLTPLFLVITLDNVNISDSGPRYVIGVQKEAAVLASQRIKKETYSKINDKNDTFILRK